MSSKGCGGKEVVDLISVSIFCKSSNQQNLTLRQYTINAKPDPCPTSSYLVLSP
jgi:hypothetical protein